jgi:hypothetical protein
MSTFITIEKAAKEWGYDVRRFRDEIDYHGIPKHKFGQQADKSKIFLVRVDLERIPKKGKA